MRPVLIAAVLLLCAAPAAPAEETMTCGQMAEKLDGMNKERQVQEKAGNKVAAAVNEGLINHFGKLFREQCLEPYACDEFADQMNTGKLPAGYDGRVVSILAYLQKTCGR